MVHPSIQAGSVPAGLAPGALPLDAGHVDHNSNIAVVLVVADVGLLQCHHNGPLEEVLASKKCII